MSSGERPWRLKPSPLHPQDPDQSFLAISLSDLLSRQGVLKDDVCGDTMCSPVRLDIWKQTADMVRKLRAWNDPVEHFPRAT